MRFSLNFVFALMLANSILADDAKQLTSLTESTGKSRVGPLIEETASEVAIFDLKEGIEFRTLKSALKKFDKGISEDAAVRTAGLPPVVAWRVAEAASRDVPIGKVAQVSQNVIYVTLGEDAGVHIGQKFDVYRKLNEILDPDTKKVLGVERPKMGVLELTEVQKSFSKGRLISDVEVKLQSGDEIEPQGGSMRVAVLPIRTEEGELLDSAATLVEEITTRLVQQKVAVLERSVLDKVILEQALQNTVLFEPDKVQRFGQLAGASVVLTGKVVTKGKLGTAFVRLIDVRTGKILLATSGSMSLVNAKIVETPSPAGRPAATATQPAGKASAVLGRSKTLPAPWTTRGRFLSQKDGGIRMSNKTDLVITRDGGYLKKDFTFEVVVNIEDSDHIAFVGLGDTFELGSYSEPKNVAMLRIHAPHLKSGVLLTKSHGQRA